MRKKNLKLFNKISHPKIFNTVIFYKRANFQIF